MSDASSVVEELAVVERLLAPAGMRRSSAVPDVLVEVGDGETAYAVSEQQGQGRFKEWQRGAVNDTLTASTVAVALRFLTYRLATVARPTWWPFLTRPGSAPWVRLETVEAGQRLSWDDDWLLFPRRGPADTEPLRFSWVVRATAKEVAASFLEPSGAPLFAVDPARSNRPT
jgi:hypothetical protein